MDLTHENEEHFIGFADIYLFQWYLCLLSIYILQAWNIFPSISAAMSCCTPQKYIWQLLIAVDSAPRFLVAFMYYNHYMAFRISGNVTLYQFLVALNSGLHMAENLSLLVLSIVTPNDNYCEFIHRTYRILLTFPHAENSCEINPSHMVFMICNFAQCI